MPSDPAARNRRTVVALVAAVLGLTPGLLPSAVAAQAGVDVLHIAPEASGSGDGSSQEDAGDLRDLPRFVDRLPDGGEVRLRADRGAYEVDGRLRIDGGGTADRSVVVRGVDGDGEPAKAVLRGGRDAPYRAGGEEGGDVVVLRDARHLVFRDLAFRDVGNAFLADGPVSDVRVSDVDATNVRRFFDNLRGAGQDDADVRDLVLRRITVEGFSKRVLRLREDSSDVLVEDVTGDSQRQEGDDFAIGVHLEGRVHDVVLRRVVMRNAVGTRPAYWNGDGFATERGVRDVLFEDTSASGNADAGYDLKSSRTRLVGARASDNKRNFRFWGDEVTGEDCRGSDPRRRGGSGSQAQVWLASHASVRLAGCTFTDDSDDTIVLELEDDARLVLRGGRVRRDPDAVLAQVERGARLELDDVDLGEDDAQR